MAYTSEPVSAVSKDSIEEETGVEKWPKTSSPPVTITVEDTDATEDSIAHYLLIAGAFFVAWNTLGLGLAFGVYQSFLLQHQLQDYSSSDIAWISTCQTFILVFFGVFTGIFFDYGYFRPLLYTGSAFITLGVFMTSISNHYYSIFLSWSVCTGVGGSCIYTTAISMLSVTFVKRRPMAISIAMVGASCGGIVYPIMFQQLEPHLGFAWAVRMQGFVVMATLAFACFGLSMRKSPTCAPRSFFDSTAFTDWPYLCYCASTSFMLMAFWVPFLFVPTFARYSVASSQSFSFYLLAIANGASVVGRMVPGLLAKWIEPEWVLGVGETVAVVLIFSWTSINSLPSFVAFCVLWGFFSGPMGVCPNTICAGLLKDKGRMGTRLGMLWAIGSFGILIGGPIAGAASRPQDNDFLGGQIFGGSIMLTALVLLLLTVWLRRRASPAE